MVLTWNVYMNNIFMYIKWMYLVLIKSTVKKIQVKKCLTKETGCLATSPLLKAGRDQTSRRNEFHFHPPTVTMGWVMKSNAGMQYKTVTLCSLQRYPGGMPPFHKSGRKVICHTEVSKYWNNFRKIIAIWQNYILSSPFSMFSTSFPLSLLSPNSKHPYIHTLLLIHKPISWLSHSYIYLIPLEKFPKLKVEDYYTLSWV